jgi:hypothetical protein
LRQLLPSPRIAPQPTHPPHTALSTCHCPTPTPRTTGEQEAHQDGAAAGQEPQRLGEQEERPPRAQVCGQGGGWLQARP